MSSNKKLMNEFVFIIWISLIQVLILNRIDFLGYINPYFYIIYVLNFKYGKNKYLFLFFSFLLGWIIDHFMDTFGIHAFSTVLIAYIRILMTKSTVEEKKITKDIFWIYNLSFFKRLIYIFLFVTLHHFILHLLDLIKIFDFNFLFFKVLYSSIFTSFLCVIYFYLNKNF